MVAPSTDAATVEITTADGNAPIISFPRLRAGATSSSAHGRELEREAALEPLPERTDGRYADPKIHVLGYSSVAMK